MKCWVYKMASTLVGLGRRFSQSPDWAGLNGQDFTTGRNVVPFPV